MQWSKILTWIPLILSIIDFALAAPVVVQNRGVGISGVGASKDGTATSPLRRDPSTNALPTARSLDSGHWQEQEPRQHDLVSRAGPGGPPEPGEPSNPPIDPFAGPPSPTLRLDPGSTSRLPTSPVPTEGIDPLNPWPSSLHGNTDSNPPPYQDQD